MGTRSVTLHGSLIGQIWMPCTTATLEVTADLTDIARRFINADGSGLIDAIKNVVDGAGDFRSARLTADSYIRISHARPYSCDGRKISGLTRYVDVAALPSLADYVSAVYAD